MEEKFRFNANIIYGTMKFLPPTYKAWRRSFFGKWTCEDAGTMPIGYANQLAVLVSDNGMRIGPDTLMDKFDIERPDLVTH